MGCRQNQANRPENDIGAMRSVVARSIATKRSRTPLLDRHDGFAVSRWRERDAPAPW
jgi:hypothetical protein